MEISSEILHAKLKDFFGFNSFKGDQEKIIKHLVGGNNAFVLMPTGGGKSLCYQLPALLMPGTAIVISPLIALMKNQVDAIRGFVDNKEGVAHFLNSSLTKTQTNEVKEDLLAGVTKLLYVAPESLTKEENINLLRQIKISFYAVDEAHCISEWGHDFRPEYRNIQPIINKIGRAPIIALTATATPKVQSDIQKNLGMMDAKVFKSSFNRENLYYEIRPKKNTEKEIIKYIKKKEGKSGIIYCLSRKKVEELAELLNVNGIKALPYHAGLDAATRAANQDKFLLEEIDNCGNHCLWNGNRQTRRAFCNPLQFSKEPGGILPGDRPCRQRWRRGRVHSLLQLQRHSETGEVYAEQTSYRAGDWKAASLRHRNLRRIQYLQKKTSAQLLWREISSRQLRQLRQLPLP